MGSSARKRITEFGALASGLTTVSASPGTAEISPAKATARTLRRAMRLPFQVQRLILNGRRQGRVPTGPEVEQSGRRARAPRPTECDPLDSFPKTLQLLRDDRRHTAASARSR